MDKKEIITRYGSYTNAIDKIGKIALYVDVILADLGDDNEAKALVQRAYKEIRKENLKLNVIDYLCYISTLFIVEMAHVDKKNPEKFIKYIIENYDTDAPETNTLLRLFNKKPEYLMRLIGTDNAEIYKELAAFWYSIYNQQLSQKSKG